MNQKRKVGVNEGGGGGNDCCLKAAGVSAYFACLSLAKNFFFFSADLQYRYLL